MSSELGVEFGEFFVGEIINLIGRTERIDKFLYPAQLFFIIAVR